MTESTQMPAPSRTDAASCPDCSKLLAFAELDEMIVAGVASPGRGTTQQRSPKKSKKSPATTRREPADDDAPRARKGHVPKKGVEQLYCATLPERQEKTGELKADGYRRIGPGEPLSAGTYDVRPSGEEDESCVVLWRAKAEVDGE